MRTGYLSVIATDIFNYLLYFVYCRWYLLRGMTIPRITVVQSSNAYISKSSDEVFSVFGVEHTCHGAYTGAYRPLQHDKSVTFLEDKSLYYVSAMDIVQITDTSQAMGIYVDKETAIVLSFDNTLFIVGRYFVDVVENMMRTQTVCFLNEIKDATMLSTGDLAMLLADDRIVVKDKLEIRVACCSITASSDRIFALDHNNTIHTFLYDGTRVHTEIPAIRDCTSISANFVNNDLCLHTSNETWICRTS